MCSSERISFASLGISEWLASQVAAVGFKSPTPVQTNCIPPILSGKDCFGCAKTGSGKTAAFALPILQRLAEEPYGVFALILTPTRELAYQIVDQFKVFGRHIALRAMVVAGGVDMMKQSLSLSRAPHIVVATPGRLADHLRSTDTLSLDKIKFLVMDEADRLLEPSFEDDLQVIMDSIPSKRQTLLFSATLTQSLSRLKQLSSNKPFYWEAPAEVATVERLDQRYVLMPSKVKDCYLVKLLEQLYERDAKTLMLFTHTCRSCQIYTLLLQHLELPCVAIHSLLSQPQRLSSLAQFKSGQVKILVATDVASRGLDIPLVEAVININVPSSPTDYIHRVGRTARAGRGGMAVTMVTQHDISRVKHIEEAISCQLTQYEYGVSERDLLSQLNTVTISRREVELRLRESDFGRRRKLRKSNHVSKSTKKQFVKRKTKRQRTIDSEASSSRD